MELRPLIASVDEQFLQKRIHLRQSCEPQDAAVAILDFGGMNDGMEQQRIYPGQTVIKEIRLVW
jgi:hypothetical protein